MSDTTPYLRRRSRALFATGVVVITLMLSILGLTAVTSVLAPATLTSMRASIPLRAFLHDGIGGTLREDLVTRIKDSFPAVKKVVLVPKDSAARQWFLQTHEDVTALNNGINPLPASLDIYFKPDSLQGTALGELQTWLGKEVIVSDVSYPAGMLTQASHNLRRLATGAGVLALLILLIVTYVVFATIRISIYADRLTIRTMQLIGASPGFIRRPYMVRGLAQGFTGALLSCFLVMLLMAVARQQFPELSQPYRISSTAFVVALGGIALFGTLIGVLGSVIAVNRYLNKPLDALA